MWMYEGVKVWLHVFLTLALDGGERLALHPGCFTPVERSLGPTASNGHGDEEKNLSLLD
jgi:hypothetical protein